MTNKRFNVLFLCTGNSARSILAEALLSKRGRDDFNAFSAGSHPTGKINPYAIELLARMGYDTSPLRSKSWDEFARPDAPELDFVFTVCDSAAGEVCPVWPGQPVTAHWGIPDPAAVDGTADEKRKAFAEAFQILERRISLFLSLPLRSLERMAVRQRLDEIGRA